MKILGCSREVFLGILNTLVVGEWRDFIHEILQQESGLHIAQIGVEVLGEIPPE